MKKEAINDTTPQWMKIDHQIQVVTGKSSIKLISAFKFQQSQSFADPIVKNNKDKLWIDATINITDFSKEYYRQVTEKQVPLQDLILYTGHVNIHKYSNQPYKIFTFLLCKVELGTAGTSTTPKIQNCDSIIIPPENGQAFQYNFFLKKHSQYQLKYEVNFTVSQDKQFKLNQLQCCNCENRVPSIYCSTEKLYFCEQCCNDHHKTKLMYSHQLQAIDRVNTLDNCKTHNHKYQLYCLKCEKYLCAQCIQKGVHAQGSDHIIKPIRYLYEEYNENIESLPKKNLQKIEVLLSNLKIKRKQIQQNEREVKQELEQQFKKNLRMLQQSVAKKYQLLDSSQLQLLMLKDRISWNQSFSVFQSNALKPIHFFKSQSLFEEEIKRIKVPDFDIILKCKPDLIYKGVNFVGVRDAFEKDQKKFKEMQTLENRRQQQKIQNRQQPPIIKLQQGRSSIFLYDQTASKPTNGELLSDLISCNLKYFKIKSK